MKKILVNYEINREIVEKLESFHLQVLFTTPNENLPEGLKGHPDLLVHQLPDGNLVVDRDNLDYYKKLFLDRKVIPSSRSIGSTYEEYVGLNSFCFGKYFVHNLKLTDEVLLEYYKRHNYIMVDVKQGYSKCSTFVGSNFLITSDMGIFKKLRDNVRIFLIDPGQIKLKNYDYGFIGGASGKVFNYHYLTGDYSNHSSRETIARVARPIVLSSGELEDFGTLMEIY